MPYSRNEDLPDSVRNHLPARAQTTYRKAFNAAWHEYGPSDERSARVAWSAVKKTFKKNGDRWIAKTAAKKPTKSTSKKTTHKPKSTSKKKRAQKRG